MRENLILKTAEVIASPRKFGHAENGVAAFVSILSENLSGQPLTRVNSKCLSITSENMRPDVLGDMFSRIGVKSVWEKIGQQLAVQQFFGVDMADRATLQAKNLLTEIMDKRNRIAHPSGEIAWPGNADLRRYIDYCDLLGTTLDTACGVWAASLGTAPPEATTI
jgi:hypothetical protein